MVVKAKPAVKKKATGTAVTLWEQQMSAAAKQQAAVEKVTGSFKSISTRNGILSIDDNPVPGNEIRAVVIVSAHENQHYEGAFNPSVLTVPVCFSLSLDGIDMKPHENSQTIQNPDCDGCWANEMGSADTGRGKACKNIRRLMLVTEDALDNASTLEEAEVRMCKVPVTSANNWAKFVNQISEDMDRPTWGVVVLIKLVTDSKTQFKMQFTFESLINYDQELFDVMQKKITELTKEIMVPYSVPEEEPAPAPRGKKAAPTPRGKVASVPAGKRTPMTKPAAGKRGKF
jgi:hypothetical protein